MADIDFHQLVRFMAGRLHEAISRRHHLDQQTVIKWIDDRADEADMYDQVFPEAVTVATRAAARFFPYCSDRDTLAASAVTTGMVKGIQNLQSKTISMTSDPVGYFCGGLSQRIAAEMLDEFSGMLHHHTRIVDWSEAERSDKLGNWDNDMRKVEQADDLTAVYHFHCHTVTLLKGKSLRHYQAVDVTVTREEPPVNNQEQALAVLLFIMDKDSRRDDHLINGVCLLCCDPTLADRRRQVFYADQSRLRRQVQNIFFEQDLEGLDKEKRGRGHGL